MDPKQLHEMEEELHKANDRNQFIVSGANGTDYRREADHWRLASRLKIAKEIEKRGTGANNTTN